MGLIRTSNTPPALVLRAEAKTEEGLARIKGVVEEALGQFPRIGPIVW